MELIVIECPRCKNKVHIDKASDEIFCMYCNTELQLKQPNTNDVDVDRELKVKMAIADRFEELYFIGGKSFEQVMSAYDDAGEIGAHKPEYWLARARFFARGKLNEISKGEIGQTAERSIIDEYTILMRIVLKYGGTKEKVEPEMNETIAKINKAFEQEEKMDRKTSRVTSGILAIPFLVLLLVFHLDDQLDDPGNYNNLAQSGDYDRAWPIVNVSVEDGDDYDRTWPLEYVARWEGYLSEVSVDNWTFERTQYNSFLEIDYLVEFMTVGSTRDGIESLEMEFSESSNALSTNLRIGEHSLEFIFGDSQYPEAVSTIAMHDVSYFDGLALYELAGYDMRDIAGIFHLHYGVTVYVWAGDIITFTYHGVEFEVNSFTSSGATVIVSNPQN